ncbi:FG-GAP repeat protein [Streptomyces zagrosensis]|uniref:Esterase n=1 Tax=Streptomyces zagrosensis TaxID=1042984 RepID=A0A7W9Q5C4_9ACTN|nr:FG-GAP repeat protein [Streptomyces zagrosensis]MBB5933866.1 hypothetical protein [Streptomyces zagrosensis]
MRKNRSAAVTAASFLLMAGAAIALAPAAHAGTPGGTAANDRNCDFNGDGYEDALLAAPKATVGGDRDAGYVAVQYGSAKGINTSHRTIIDQSTPGVPGSPEPGDAFGQALATGDLDSDGFDDAVIGIPNEDIGTVADAGGVTVLWGSKSGLTGRDSSWLESQEPTAKETYGIGVAAARFTSDTPGDVLAILDRDDLEVSWWASGAQQRAAAPRGLEKSALADEGKNIAPSSLTTGDYDRNGYADLVISGTSTGEEPGHGWSTLLAGQADGLVYQRDLRGGPVAASGDINGDSYDDLVTSEPHSPDDGGETMTGGLVGVYLGSEEGPVGQEGTVGSPPQWWTQDSPGVAGVAEQGDGWGSDLSLGDTNGDGYADLAIGASGEDIGTVPDAGAVWLLRGSAQGLTATKSVSYDQNSVNVPGDAEKADAFGGQVRLIDPNKDGKFGLLAAAPGENTGDGVVWVLSANAGGLTSAGSWTYGGGSLNAPSADAAFGATIDE